MGAVEPPYCEKGWIRSFFTLLSGNDICWHTSTQCFSLRRLGGGQRGMALGGVSPPYWGNGLFIIF